MLTGSLPFEGKSLTAKITADTHPPCLIWCGWGRMSRMLLADLIQHMLAKDPQQAPSVRLWAASSKGF